MIFILRRHPGSTAGDLPKAILRRPTPAYADPQGGIDLFIVGDAAEAERLAAEGHTIVRLRDGWYEVGAGGVAIWGEGRYFEIRDTPFTVAEASH